MRGPESNDAPRAASVQGFAASFALPCVATLRLCTTLLAIGCGDASMAPPESETPPAFAPAIHAAFPVLPYNGGLVLSSPRLVVIVPANHSLADSLFLFARQLAGSAWARAVGSAYGFAIRPDVRTVSGPAATGAGTTVADIGKYVAGVIAAQPDLAADGQTVYLVFEPPAVALAGPACAYHAGYDGMGDALAVVGGCTAGTPQSLAGLAPAASHEIAEAASDPLNTGWYIPANRLQPWLTTPWALDDGAAGTEENGDLCQTGRWIEGGFAYQRIWSNAAAGSGGDPCIPAVDAPYYSVSSKQEWYAVTNGSARIVLTGWSTASIETWAVGAATEVSSIKPTLTLDTSDSIAVLGARSPAARNGSTLTLSVSFPSGAPRSSWAVIKVLSLRLNGASGTTRPGEDLGHPWVIGVYIP
jgi:hypothetical protein